MPLFRRRRRPGQAMTETVLLFPMLVFFLFAFAKIYALLILVQKIEIASFYAARRWQLESHRNANYLQADGDANGGAGGGCGGLCGDIQTKVKDYLGYGQASGTFLGLGPKAPWIGISRTQVWQIVTLTVYTQPINLAFFQSKGFTFEVTKYVPNRDRPIAFVLPGSGS
jgi:hypothetical protein